MQTIKVQPKHIPKFSIIQTKWTNGSNNTNRNTNSGGPFSSGIPVIQSDFGLFETILKWFFFIITKILISETPETTKHYTTFPTSQRN